MICLLFFLCLYTKQTKSPTQRKSYIGFSLCWRFVLLLTSVLLLACLLLATSTPLSRILAAVTVRDVSLSAAAVSPAVGQCSCRRCWRSWSPCWCWRTRCCWPTYCWWLTFCPRCLHGFCVTAVADIRAPAGVHAIVGILAVVGITAAVGIIGLAVLAYWNVKHILDYRARGLRLSNCLYIMISDYRNIEYRTGELEKLSENGDYGHNVQKTIGCPPLVKFMYSYGTTSIVFRCLVCKTNEKS